MIISFTPAFAVIAALLLAGPLLAAGALLLGRRAARRARLAGTAAEIATLRLAELEATVATTVVRLQALTEEQERVNAVPSRPSLREAVALSRRGASAEEIVDACRIGQGEARLIQVLYGTPRASAATPGGAEIH